MQPAASAGLFRLAEAIRPVVASILVSDTRGTVLEFSASDATVLASSSIRFFVCTMFDRIDDQDVAADRARSRPMCATLAGSEPAG